MRLAELIERRERDAKAKIPLDIRGLITLHPGQEAVQAGRKRFTVVACGRRWGKTRYGVYDVCQRVSVAGTMVGWFAPTYKLLNDAWDELYGHLANSGVIESSNKTERVIRLVNGSSVEFWTMDDPDCGRSRRYHLVIIDEAAKQVGLKGIWQKAIMPTLADFQGDALFLSTPRGSSGFFFEAYMLGKSEDDWASFRMPTSSNPYILKSEIDRAEASSLPTVFAQEWLADFVQPAGAVYDVFSVESHVVRPFRIGKDWKIFAGLDFGSANSAFVLVTQDPDTGVYYITHDYHAAGDAKKHKRAMDAILNERKVTMAWGGASGEVAPREEWLDAGLAVQKPSVSGSGSVEAGINAVYQLLRSGKLKVFSSCERAISQFLSYTYKVDIDDRVTDLIEDKAMYHVLDAVRYVMSSVVDYSPVIDRGQRIEHVERF